MRIAGLVAAVAVYVLLIAAPLAIAYHRHEVQMARIEGKIAGIDACRAIVEKGLGKK